MTKIRQPDRVKDRSDEIADLVAVAGEKLTALATEWFKLNDSEALAQARDMLDDDEVTLMLSVHRDQNGLGQVALNLLRTDTPMPKPFFVVRVPMLRWTVHAMTERMARPAQEGFFSTNTTDAGKSDISGRRERSYQSA